jgi:hypothetical protein
VRGFAREVLRLTRVFVTERRRLGEGTNVRVFAVLSCSAGEFCPASGFLITVSQIPRTDAPSAWSVVKVGPPRMAIAFHPGAVVPEDPVRVPVELPEGSRVYAGLSFSGHVGPCAVADFSIVRHGSVEISGARGIRACGGPIELPANGTVVLCAACHVRPRGSAGPDVFGLLRSLSPPGALAGVAVVPVRVEAGGSRASP